MRDNKVELCVNVAGSPASVKAEKKRAATDVRRSKVVKPARKKVGA
jgi:hypothetical protein